MAIGRVIHITADQVRVSCDQALVLGALARSESGWMGQVSEDRGGEALIRPFDATSVLTLGEPITLTDALPHEGLDFLRGGEVIDPLGRSYDGSFESALPSGSHRGMLGFGPLEQILEPRERTAVLVAGDESVGPARLLAEAVAHCDADWLVTVTQGGRRELERIRRSIAAAGLTQRAVSLWCPLWQPPALSALLPQTLETILRQPMAGRGLVVFDDLRRWIEVQRQLDESMPLPLTPEGFAAETRGELCRLLNLAGELENRFVFLAGWSFDRLFPSLAAHPFGPVVELLADQGLVLDGHDEGYGPHETSWGYPQGPLSCRDRLQSVINVAPAEAQDRLDRLVSLLNEGFLTLLPERMDDYSPVLWQNRHKAAFDRVLNRILDDEPLEIPLFRFDGSESDSARERFLRWLEEEGR